LREAENSPMKIERWAGTGFSWDFDHGGAQPKGPAGEIPGWPLTERIQGGSFGVIQGARTALRGRQPDAQGAALLVRLGRGGREVHSSSFAEMGHSWLRRVAIKENREIL